MKKLLFLVALFSYSFLSAYANDLLKIATNGMFNSNSFGAKTLNTKEMQEIKGGYQLYTIDDSSNGLMIAIAIPNDTTELSSIMASNGNLISFLPDTNTVGICGLGITECYQNKATKAHWESNIARFYQYTSALGSYTLAQGYYLSFIVSRNIGINAQGQRYSYFTYTPTVINLYNGSVGYPNTGLNNPIVREIKANVEKNFTDRLGGLWIR
ncbi:MAG: bacteriocin [Campylobacter hyointestinalis]